MYRCTKLMEQCKNSEILIEYKRNFTYKSQHRRKEYTMDTDVKSRHIKIIKKLEYFLIAILPRDYSLIALLPKKFLYH